MDFSENALDTAGNNDKSENHENVILGEYYEIKLGMQVSSEEEAYTCSFNILFTVQLQLRLCLVAVKRFPENTYFPKMLISGKGKCFHGVWLHFKKFSGKYFLVFGKEEGKHKLEKHKPQIQENTNPE